MYRPFPVDEIVDALAKFKAIAIMDKTDSFNAAGGPLFSDITSAMYAKGVFGPKVINFTYGLGGRDVKAEDVEAVCNEVLKVAETEKVESVYNYIA